MTQPDHGTFDRWWSSLVMVRQMLSWSGAQNWSFRGCHMLPCNSCCQLMVSTCFNWLCTPTLAIFKPAVWGFLDAVHAVLPADCGMLGGNDKASKRRQPLSPSGANLQVEPFGPKKEHEIRSCSQSRERVKHVNDFGYFSWIHSQPAGGRVSNEQFRVKINSILFVCNSSPHSARLVSPTEQLLSLLMTMLLGWWNEVSNKPNHLERWGHTLVQLWVFGLSVQVPSFWILLVDVFHGCVKHARLSRRNEFQVCKLRGRFDLGMSCCLYFTYVCCWKLKDFPELSHCLLTGSWKSLPVNSNHSETIPRRKCWQMLTDVESVYHLSWGR